SARGVGQALRAMQEPETELVRRRVRVIAGSPALRAGTVQSSAPTEARVRDQLIADGTPVLDAQVVAAALMAGLTAALLAWAQDGRASLPAAIGSALLTLEGAGA